MSQDTTQYRHCGTMKDVECLWTIYPDALTKRYLTPDPPSVVDVDIPKIEELCTQTLPESSN